MLMETSENIIKIIQRQTDYSEETARIKLEQHNNNYIAVIQDYMIPKNKTKKESTILEKSPVTTNQKIFHEIRKHMDIMKH